MNHNPKQPQNGPNRPSSRRDFSAPAAQRPEALDEFVYDVYRAAVERERSGAVDAQRPLSAPCAHREPVRQEAARREPVRQEEARCEPAARTGGKRVADSSASKRRKARAQTSAQSAKKPKKSRAQRLRTAVTALLLLCGLYCIAVFSDIPFIKKWREIYIETAMGTMTHQWLATAFIPDFVIAEVMDTRTDIEGAQNGIETDWTMDSLSNADKKIKWSKLKKSFFKLYPEIEKDSFNAYLDEHEDQCLTEDGYLVIDKAGLDDEDTGIRTVHGDRVLAIDTENGLTIIEVTGSEYVGRLAIVKDPGQVTLGLSENFGKSGSVIADIAEANDAVLAINGSGFYDPGGHGNGGTPHGLVIHNGELLWDWVGQGGDKAIGFDKNDQLNIRSYQPDNDFRDAVEFKPVLVLDGEKIISGSAGWGMQPRSAIGQTDDGQVLLLIVDGRQPGWSIGCTMGDLADIMERYGAEQACNLDGGSSSIMYYNGRKITKPSAGDKQNGRLLPNAFIVKSR